ncbi:MAG TPA: methyltransferase domain-containing protein [Polyangiales bacterium]
MVSFALDSSDLAGTYDRVSSRQYEHGKLLVMDLGIQPGQRVLDVGCGTGRLSAYVASLVAPYGVVHAVDPLPHRVEVARQRARANLHLSVGSAEDLSSFPSAAFDVVYFNSVFHWLEDQPAALREARRVLAPGGVLGISTATEDAPHDLELVLKRAYERPELAANAQVPSGVPHRVSAARLRTLLADARFTERSFRVRSFVDLFQSADEVVEFNLASSFGNFLSSLGEQERASALRAFAEELEDRRTSQGIRLRRNLIFAVAEAAA